MIIDLTHTITPEMPMYPGSAAPSIKPTGSLTRDGFRETQLTIASHTGTHMDAPSHMLPRGSTLEVLPASQFCGRAVVLDVSDLPPRSVITADYLREQNRDHPLGGFRAVLHRLGAEVGHRRLL